MKTISTSKILNLIVCYVLIFVSHAQILPTSLTVTVSGGVTNLTVRGGNLTFTGVVSPDNATDKSVTWSTVPASTIATINSAGVLTALADGVVTVVAVSNAVSSVTGSYVLTLSNQRGVTSVSLSSVNNIKILLVNNAFPLTATVLPANASNPALNWTTSNSTMATVSGIGQVRGIGPGIVTITAISVDNPTVSGMYVVTVVQRVTGITVTGEGGVNSITTPGGSLQMTATVEPDNASNKTVRWAVNNSSIAVINSITGLLTAIRNGNVMVTASALDGSGVGGVRTVSISNQTTSSPPVTVTSFTLNGSSSVAVGQTITLTSAIEPSTATVTGITYLSSNPAVASVSNNGAVTGISVGVITVTGSFTLESVNYSAFKVITVTLGIAGFEGEKSIMELIVAPNPANNGNITVYATQGFYYHLINSIGQQVASGLLVTGVNTITGISPGFYTLFTYRDSTFNSLKIWVK